MSAYLRRRRRIEYQQKQEERKRSDAAVRAELARDTFLPMRVVLNPENYQGANPLGVPWGEWAVTQREEAALALLVRKDYRERMDTNCAEAGARLLALGAARWPNVAQRLIGEYRDVLLERTNGDAVVAHHLVNASKEAGLQLLSDPEIIGYRSVPHGRSVVEIAVRKKAVAEEVLRKHTHLGYTQQSNGWPLFQGIAEHSDLVLKTLAIPGVGALPGPTGLKLAEWVIVAFRWDPARLSRLTPAVWALPSRKGGTLAHWVVREFPGFAAALIAMPGVACIADERGVTVAHEAVAHSTDAAEIALRDPELGALTDASGRSVRRSAADRIRTPSAYFNAMRQRLQEIVDQTRAAPNCRRGITPPAPVPSDDAVRAEHSPAPQSGARRRGVADPRS